MNQQELENRLIDFAVLVSDTVDLLPGNLAGCHLASQLIRSGSAPALNYGEARAAESRIDFAHKNKIILKELRETLICFRIIERASLFPNNMDILSRAFQESNELVSIFVKTLKSLVEK